MTSEEQDGSHIGYIRKWTCWKIFHLGLRDHDTNEAAKCAPALSPQTEISLGLKPCLISHANASRCVI